MAKALSLFILACIPFIFTGSYNVIIDLLNYLMTAISPAIVNVIGLFPPNPCGSLIGSCSTAHLTMPDLTLLAKCLSALAWFLPISYLVNMVGCVMLSVMCFFTMAPLARWFKLIT